MITAQARRDRRVEGIGDAGLAEMEDGGGEHRARFALGDAGDHLYGLAE